MATFCDGYGANSSGNSAKAQFDDPFLLPSSEYMPTNMQEALDFCRFLYLNNPEYRRASQRVTRHFITDYKITEVESDTEKAEIEDFLDYSLGLRQAMMEMGDDWACFSGDTPVQTEEGVFPIKELEGKTANVLGDGGKFRPAKFKCFGKQNLYELEFKDSTKVRVTGNHEWVVKNCSGKIRRLTTDKLNLGHTFQRTMFKGRPEKNEEYTAGVRHGFIFGDGSRYNLQRKNPMTMAFFFGEKDKALYPFFEDHPNKIRKRESETRYELHFQTGHPGNFKSLPSKDASASYWYGFICGFIAADGHVDPRDGCVVLEQSDPAVLEAISEQAPRVGMHAGVISGPIERAPREFIGRDGETYTVDEGVDYRMHILRNTVVLDDIIIDQHRDNFKSCSKSDSNYGEFVGLKSIKNLNVKEDVYCCEEMETHTMSVGNGILTGNCFGNAFYRIHFPFKRMLTRKDSSGRNVYYDVDAFQIDQVRFSLSNMQYHAVDPKTRKQECFDFVDIRQKNKDAITLVKYDPRTIDIIHSPYTKNSRYLYRIPAPIISDVKNNNIFQINNLSKKMLTAIRDGKNFLFSNNEMFHFRAPTTSGVSDSDWGMPELISNFRLLHQLQVYKKIDEQVGLDYMLPFRILSMDNNKANASSQKLDAVRWKQEMKKIVETRRKDKTAMFAVPVPVQYQEFSGQGKALSPKDLIEYQTNNMLNAMGYPAELYTMSLKTDQLPSAIRLFEQTFWFIHENYNNFCRWVLSKINTYLNNQRIDISLKQPSMADSIDKQNVLLQLVSQGELPRSAVFREFGIDDPVQAFRERQEEDAEFAKIQKKTEEKVQKEMDAEASLAAAADPGSDPSGEEPGTTPLDMEQRAMRKAQEWLEIPSDGERTKAMNATKAQDFQLYSMAKQVMEEMRSEGASQGRQAVEQQAQQQPPM